jgi:hypothetical protein
VKKSGNFVDKHRALALTEVLRVEFVGPVVGLPEQGVDALAAPLRLCFSG